MASPGNQHRANYIGALSFRYRPIEVRTGSPAWDLRFAEDFGSTEAVTAARTYTALSISLYKRTRSSAIAERPRDASCQLKSCQLPRNSAETTCTTSPEPSISCR